MNLQKCSFLLHKFTKSSTFGYIKWTQYKCLNVVVYVHMEGYSGGQGMYTETPTCGGASTAIYEATM